jgi:predicted amidophosphoribosyltransferase
MNSIKTRPLCSRCKKSTSKEVICSGCISELLELHDYRISWKMALEIEKEESEGEDIVIEIQ